MRKSGVILLFDSEYLCYQFIFIRCCFIMAEMLKAGDAFRVSLNSAIVPGLNGSVLQKQPVSAEQNRGLSAAKLGLLIQINLRGECRGQPVIMEKNLFPIICPVTSASQWPHVPTSS